MNQDVSNYISKCTVCANHPRHQRKEPLITNDLPITPWSKIPCNLFELNQKDFLFSFFQKYHNTPFVPPKPPTNTAFTLSWDLLCSQEKIKAVPMQNLGGTNKEHYGFSESGLLLSITTPVSSKSTT